jgi:hypothetical protein
MKLLPLYPSISLVVTSAARRGASRRYSLKRNIVGYFVVIWINIVRSLTGKSLNLNTPHETRKGLALCKVLIPCGALYLVNPLNIARLLPKLHSVS